MKERPILFSAPMVNAILEGRKTQTRRVVKPKKSAEGLLIDPNKSQSFASEHMESLELQGFVDAGTCWFPPHPYEPGDRLWVRETWLPGEDGDECGIRFKADNGFVTCMNTVRACDQWISVRRPEEQYPQNLPPKWRPSIHMPRWASRITLEVTNLQYERLQDISEEDCKAEGVQLPVNKETGSLLLALGSNSPADYLGEHNCKLLHDGGTDRTGQQIDMEDWWRAHFASLWDTINKDKQPWESNPWVWVVEFKLYEVAA